jgi:very-short-patch-repair endonuclease
MPRLLSTPVEPEAGRNRMILAPSAEEGATLVNPPVHIDIERRRALSIFRYLRALALLKTKVTSDLNSYERVFWLEATRGKSGCSARCFRPEPGNNAVAVESADDEVWLEVRKLAEPASPSVPTGIERWLTPGSGSNADSLPQLLDKIKTEPVTAGSPPAQAFETLFAPETKDAPSPNGLGTGPSAERWELLENHPEVTVAFHDYLERSWKPWVIDWKTWRDFQDKVYAPLFNIHRDLKRLGEEFELVLGVGCLSWHTPSGQLVRRHLIAAQVTLEFDPAAGVFMLRPGSDGAKLVLEMEMLDPTEQPTMAQMGVVNGDLSKAEDNPWDFDAIDRAVRGVVQAIDMNGTYDPAVYAPKPPERTPRATYSPALLLRRRTARGLLVTFDSVIEQLEKGGDIPAGVRILTREADPETHDFAPDGSRSAIDATAGGRIYFPLPANEEQRQIIERLDSKHGVLVQGPPGTGKSHTIANLICHLLATGQRVLITAQTPRALQVLRDKLPEEVRPLCLSLLGNDKGAHDNVEHSVRGITGKADGWDAEVATTEMRRTDRELDRALNREAVLERDARTFREAEVHEHTIADGSYRGTAQAIAQCVGREQPRFAWFTDTGVPDAMPDISADDLRSYRDALLQLLPQRVAEVGMRRPVRASDIPCDDELLSLIRRHHALQARVRPAADDELPFSALPLDELKEACATLRALQAAAQKLPVAATPWVAVALADVLRGITATWDMLARQTSAAVGAASDVAAKLETTDIRLPAGRRSDVLLADVSDLLSHLQRGGRLGFWVFRPRLVRRTTYILAEATVDGRPCRTMEALGIVKEHLKCSATIAKAWAHWEDKSAPNTKTNGSQVEELRQLADILTQVLALTPLANEASAALARLHLSSIPPLHDLRAVNECALRCEQVIDRRELGLVNSDIDAHVRNLRIIANAADAHPIGARLAEAVERRDEFAVKNALGGLTALDADAQKLAERAAMEARIASALPQLARTIRETTADPAWNERIANWTAACRWAQACAWLGKYTDSQKAAAVESELRQVKATVGSLLGQAAAEKAWHSCLSAMSPAHRQRLNAWRQAIKRIGKGTGKHAGHWRRVAQMELERCRTAIPAWVMPLYRVFETVKPSPGMFDIAIVDEASQCGPESLILFYLAKKVIVVGDDKQISPSNVGLDRDQERQLLEQHLGDVDLAHTFNADASLFDHGQIRLGKRITLREHFRCVPEIIRFSNDLCYRGSLIPLRQYPPRRLAPFVARYIAIGKREGSSQSARNEAEATAIVETIAACCDDPMYEGKAIGVISLLGEHQAKLIERLLLNRIGAEEIERRRIVCGDAYAFQGDERHVVFLSMVVAPRDRSGSGLTALAKRSDEQRFNVAASRAQDQLWLFHSVMPEDIGNHDCMRHKLLTYFYDPARHAVESAGLNLEELRRRASAPDRPQGTQPSPFDSWFEVDVYLRLAARGYRVLPQYEAGRHRIDLVVEGNTRLAVECDGDTWHGPDQFDQDMARQRQLERAGWRFWRLPGGTFYSDPDRALAPLWTLLGEMGIKPMPALDGSGSSEGYVPKVKTTEA